MENNQDLLPEDENKLLIRKLAYLLRLEMGICPMPENEEEVTWFDEYFEKHPNLFQDSDAALKEMEGRAILSWFELASYLRQQLRQGKTEFRISGTGDREFLIRPFGKCTETLKIRV